MAGPAVSVRRIRFPRLTGFTPIFSASWISSSSKPPSGPINTATCCPGAKLLILSSSRPFPFPVHKGSCADQISALLYRKMLLLSSSQVPPEGYNCVWTVWPHFLRLPASGGSSPLPSLHPASLLHFWLQPVHTCSSQFYCFLQDHFHFI